MVVLVRGSGGADQRVVADVGSTRDVAVSSALPGGSGWVAALALPLAPGATTLPASIGVDWSPAAGGNERLAPLLTLTEQAPTATTPLPNGQNCGSPTPTTLPGSGECLKLQVPGASTASCPKTTLPPTCTYVNPGGPAETVKPGTATPELTPGTVCGCATTTRLLGPELPGDRDLPHHAVVPSRRQLLRDGADARSPASSGGGSRARRAGRPARRTEAGGPGTSGGGGGGGGLGVGLLRRVAPGAAAAVAVAARRRRVAGRAAACCRSTTSRRRRNRNPNPRRAGRGASSRRLSVL